MLEPQMTCVQQDTPEFCYAAFQILTYTCCTTGAVDWITDDAETKRTEMYANLVRSTGFQRDLQPRCSQAGGRKKPIMGDRALAASHHRHALSILRMPPDRLIDSSRRLARHTPDDGFVSPVDAVHGELRGQADMSLVGLGDHHQAAHILIEAMDDAWPLHAANPGECACAVMQEGVHQRAAVMAGGRVHHHARGLFQDQQMLVLEQHVQRDRFGSRRRWPGVRHSHGKALARFDPGRGVRYWSAIPADLPGRHQRLQPRARQIGEAGREELVEPKPGIVGAGGDIEPVGHRIGKRKAKMRDGSHAG